MIRSFKIRLYPTKEQERLMWKHIGACRYVYNYMLEKQKELYSSKRKHLSQFDMIRLLTPLKNDGKHAWLYEVSCASLQRICGDVDKAYRMFFKKKTGFPKFKSRKRNKINFPIDFTKLWFDESCFSHISKFGKIKFKTDFNLPIGKGYKFINPRISNVNNKWILSFGMECESQVFSLNDYNVGIDLGIKDSAIVVYNDKKLVFKNINKSKKIRMYEEQIRHTQRSISRKYEANKKGSKYVKTKNIEKEEDKLRKLYARISNIRDNYIHQSTRKIISLLPKKIIMEDLNIVGMMKNKHLSKAIQDQCLSEWIRQIKYKSEWMSIEFIQVDRFFPSSKTCHSCGCINHNLKLKDRTFVCPDCGYTEDRDYNAALNLMSYED